MKLPDFANFFLACAGAAATLIGLLFVAVSIAPACVVGSQAIPERRSRWKRIYRISQRVFLALTGLIPGVNLGIVAIVIGTSSLLSMVSLTRALMARKQKLLRLARGLLLVLISALVYGWEIFGGFQFQTTSLRESATNTIATLMIAVLGIGLTRAWQTLGAHTSGLFGWLSPLRGLDENEQQTK